MLRAKLLARGDVDAIVHENVQNFPEKLLIDNLSFSAEASRLNLSIFTCSRSLWGIFFDLRAVAPRHELQPCRCMPIGSQRGGKLSNRASAQVCFDVEERFGIDTTLGQHCANLEHEHVKAKLLFLEIPLASSRCDARVQYFSSEPCLSQ